jgi:thiamine-phosphate pyrophosphorylase
MLFYYISDRRQFPGSAREQRRALLAKISEAARQGVNYIQLREKDLSARELLQLAYEALERIRDAAKPPLGAGDSELATRLLINSRLDIALAGGVHGVHLRSDDISAADARDIFMKTGHLNLETGNFLVGVSCHTQADVRRAISNGADLAVFAPVFEKGGQPGVGLEALRAACRETAAGRSPEPSAVARIPVFALGGVSLENARACAEAGAAGIAAIRLFQDNSVEEVVTHLRRITQIGS